MRNKESILREIEKLTKRYYEKAHKENGEFIPGETKIPYAGRIFDEQEIYQAVVASLEFWLTEGRFVKEFEKEFSLYLGASQSVCLTNSGSSANLLAVSALTSPLLKDRAVKPGDEIITTAAGFPTTINPIFQNQLIPVFIDVDPLTYNTTVERVERAISPKTKGLILAHTLGFPFPAKEIAGLARKRGLWLIEDTCDALGAEYQGEKAGTFGDLATFSFYPPHHITMGEGGAVVMKDRSLWKIIRSFRDWGRDCWCDTGKSNTCGKRFGSQYGELPFGYDHKYVYSHIGYNLKLTEPQAAIGVAQLKKLPRFVLARRANFDFFLKNLSRYKDFFSFARFAAGIRPNPFGFLLTISEQAPFAKNDLVCFLEERKIETRQLFAGNATCQPAYLGKNFRIAESLTNTDRIMRQTLWFGVYPGLKKIHLEYIVESIEEFIQQGPGPEKLVESRKILSNAANNCQTWE
ncbi:MAG: lipopolysaccharide biosynthesis protein RfbH [Candidatus Omnitrophica bacterium]|nr:lipopolysaccharide biosynthesis protein RfbH [Candidatus Omnitrophota bacterium]